jgi:hypothetical protein
MRKPGQRVTGLGGSGSGQRADARKPGSGHSRRDDPGRGDRTPIRVGLGDGPGGDGGPGSGRVLVVFLGKGLVRLRGEFSGYVVVLLS